MVHYGALKTALNAYTLSLAGELAARNIRVNIVTPGGVLTPGGDEVRQVMLDAMGVPAEALFKQMIRSAGRARLGRLPRPSPTSCPIERAGSRAPTTSSTAACRSAPEWQQAAVPPWTVDLVHHVSNPDRSLVALLEQLGCLSRQVQRRRSSPRSP